MSYTPNVPQGNQQIASTQVPILNNFTYIDTAMKVNHTWNGNNIATEAAGSHQRLDMPNQGADIVALPAGINAVIYSIGGNIFSYNGAKRPISGVSGAAVIGLSGSFTTLFTVPNDCIGYVMIQGNTVPLNQSLTFAFNMFGGTPFWQQPYPVVGAQVPLSVAIVGNNFQAATLNAATYNAFIKYIYWPI